jgi:DeoR/GlpR family transcriptional regulator of sugar metabolism
MIEIANKLIIVADHTKFGRSAMIPVAQLEAADIVVSDTGLAAEYVNLLRDKGVEVLLA